MRSTKFGAGDGDQFGAAAADCRRALPKRMREYGRSKAKPRDRRNPCTPVCALEMSITSSPASAAENAIEQSQRVRFVCSIDRADLTRVAAGADKADRASGRIDRGAFPSGEMPDEVAALETHCAPIAVEKHLQIGF